MPGNTIAAGYSETIEDNGSRKDGQGAEAEIESGEFITAEDLKKEGRSWNLEQNGESSITESLQLYCKRFSSDEQKTKKVY